MSKQFMNKCNYKAPPLGELRVSGERDQSENISFSIKFLFFALYPLRHLTAPPLPEGEA